MVAGHVGVNTGLSVESMGAGFCVLSAGGYRIEKHRAPPSPPYHPCVGLLGRRGSVLFHTLSLTPTRPFTFRHSLAGGCIHGGRVAIIKVSLAGPGSARFLPRSGGGCVCL